MYPVSNDLIERIIRQESGGNPNAVSPVGAMGLMQIMPETARDAGFGMAPLTDPFNAEANRAFGTEYFGHLMNRYQGDTNRALAAYNWGMGNADRWDGNLGSLPEETRNYITAINGGAPEQISTRGADMQMPQQQQPQGILEYFGVQKQGQGPQGDLPFYQRDQFRDMAGRVAVAANTLRQNPDQNIPAMAEMRRQERQANRTADWLAQQPGSAEFVQMLQSGGDPSQVLMAYRQSRQPAAAADPTSGMQNYQFLLSQGMDPTQAMERAFGAGGTTVNVGGNESSVGWEAIDKAYADTWLRDSTSGLADVASQAAQIASVLERLESGEELTGPAIGVQGDFLRALTNPEAQDAKDRVEQVVQRSLRETLGAQFTQAEGDRLIARAYNINLTPQQNAARLRALLTQLQSVALQKQAMRQHFNENGTLRGFNGNMNIPTIDDLLATMDAAAPSGAPAGGQPSGGLSPEDLEYLGIGQ